MSAEIPESLTLKELAKATGFIVRTNCCAKPMLHCWQNDEGWFVYTGSATPEVGDPVVGGAEEGFISNGLPVEAVPAPDTIVINGVEYYRWTHGDAHL